MPFELVAVALKVTGLVTPAPLPGERTVTVLPDVPLEAEAEAVMDRLLSPEAPEVSQARTTKLWLPDPTVMRGEMEEVGPEVVQARLPST